MLDSLVHTMREELLQTGELLAFLEEAEELSPAELQAEILTQYDRLRRLRHRHDKLERDLAQRVSHGETASLEGLIPALPRGYGILLQALSREISEAEGTVDALRNSKGGMPGLQCDTIVFCAM